MRFSAIGYLHDDFGWDRWLDGWDDFQRLGLATGEIAIDPRNPRVQYYGSQGDLMKSEDWGQRWHRIRPSEFGRYLALAVDPVQPLTVYAGSSDSRLTGVFRSRDGATFESVVPGLVAGIEVSWSRPGEVYAVLGGGIYRSRDGGSSWQALQDRVRIRCGCCASPSRRAMSSTP